MLGYSGGKGMLKFFKAIHNKFYIFLIFLFTPNIAAT